MAAPLCATICYPRSSRFESPVAIHSIIATSRLGYEATRRRMVWNQRIPYRFPEVIVTATSDADVIEAVKLARSRGLRISVRAGGHSWIATSLRDGGMLVDLSRLNSVTMDAGARMATVQPAIKNTEVVAALEDHGLAFPAGHWPTVAVGGYLLAGGQGWNQGTWGVACKNVMAIDLVNAEGELITADGQRNSDLLWAETAVEFRCAARVVASSRQVGCAR